MDTTNPGVVNVANQAFKPDLGENVLIVPLDNGILDNPGIGVQPTPSLGTDSTTFPTPAEVVVATEPPSQPSQDFGTPVPPAVSVDLAVVSVSPVDVKDFVVTEVGSIEINQSEALVTFTVTNIIDYDTGLPVTPSTVNIGLTVAPATLLDYKVTMVGRELQFSLAAISTLVDKIRVIVATAKNFVVIPNNDSDGNPLPVINVNDQFEVDTARRGAEVMFDNTGIVVNTTPVTFPLLPPPINIFQNIQPPSNVLIGLPFIGEGVQIPTAVNVNVSDQAPPSFPKNVFP